MRNNESAKLEVAAAATLSAGNGMHAEEVNCTKGMEGTWIPQVLESKMVKDGRKYHDARLKDRLRRRVEGDSMTVSRCQGAERLVECDSNGDVAGICGAIAEVPVGVSS